MSYIKSTDNLVEGLSNLFFSASRAKSAVQSDLDSLSSRITSEVSRAQGAESTLSGRLDVVEGTGTGSIKKALQDAKDYADSAVSVEVSARQSAVSAEQTRAQGAESVLSGRLDVIEGSGTGSIAKSLVDAKAYADQKIADLVNGAPGMLDTLKEIADQLANDESAVSALTSTVAANLQTAKNYADAAVLVETQARQTAVSGEASARQSADSVLSGRLDVLEGSGAGSVAKALADAKAYADQKVSDEASARASAVSAEQTRAQGIEAGLRTDLTSEISRAQGIEGGLRTDLNAEISNRQSAVSAEQSRAQAEEATMFKKDGSRSLTGNLLFSSDGANNVGAVGANRPNKMLGKSLLQIGGAVDSTVLDSANAIVAVGDGAGKKMAVNVYADNANGTIGIRRARGSEASPQVVNQYDRLGQLSFAGWTGSSFKGSASVNGYADETWTSSAYGSHLEFMVTPVGTTQSQVALIINNDLSAVFSGSVTAAGGKFQCGQYAGGKILVSNGTTLDESSVDSAKLSYLANVTSDIQSQINSEASARTSEDLTLVKLDGSRAMTGLLTMNGGMNVQGPMYFKNGATSINKTLGASNGPIQGVSSLSGGSVTFTLPQPSAGRMFIFKDQSGQASQSTYIQINPYGSETIDGGSNYKLVAPYESVTVYCDGTNWYIA